MEFNLNLPKLIPSQILNPERETFLVKDYEGIDLCNCPIDGTIVTCIPIIKVKMIIYRYPGHRLITNFHVQLEGTHLARNESADSAFCVPAE